MRETLKEVSGRLMSKIDGRYYGMEMTFLDQRLLLCFFSHFDCFFSLLLLVRVIYVLLFIL